MWKARTALTTLAFTLVTPIVGLTQDVPVVQKSVPEQVVDSFNTVFGVHPGGRAVHAKGVVLEGTFTPSASATSVSKAAHLQQKRTSVPVTIRFSNPTGLPAIPDTDPGAKLFSARSEPSRLRSGSTGTRVTKAHRYARGGSARTKEKEIPKPWSSYHEDGIFSHDVCS
jgi:hypothetical protein